MAPEIENESISLPEEESDQVMDKSLEEEELDDCDAEDTDEDFDLYDDDEEEDDDSILR